MVNDDAMGSMIESVCGLLYLRGEHCDSLSKCLESYEHRFKVLEGTRFSLVNPELRDQRMTELEKRGK